VEGYDSSLSFEAMRILIIILLLVGCSVIKKPGGTTDSTIVTIDSIHTTVDGKDSVIHRNRSVHITHESTYNLKPFFWYLLFIIVAATTFFIIKK